MPDTISKESARIIKEQQARLSVGNPQTKMFPTKNIDKLVSLLEGVGFTALEKNDDTIWGAYRAPQVLLVLDRQVNVAKGKTIGQRVTIYEKDGGKVSANCDINAIWKEIGL